MVNNKVKYILALFIILCLSMNAFSATNFTDDSNDVALQSSSSIDELAADAAEGVIADEGTGGQTGDDTGGQTGDDTGGQTGDNTGGQTGDDTGGQTGDDTGGQTGDNSGGQTGDDTGGQTGGQGTFNFGNGTGMNFSGMNFSGMGGSNSSSFDFSSLMDIFSKLMGGDNATNETNTTTTPATNDSATHEVSNVPRVVTSTSYVPVSYHPVEKHSQHIIQRLRDNKTICKGDSLNLEGVNNLYESHFTNGHLIVYVDGKLVFNEITTDDLNTPIFWITDDYLGQHQISVEFTANGNSNTNTYTEDVLII